MKIPRSAVHRVVIDGCLEVNAKQATVYLSPFLIVNATRNKSSRKHHVEIHLTVGRPNYAQRVFIAACQRAGEPFPVKKMQLKFDRKR